MKKFISVMLALVMMLSTFACIGFADSESERYFKDGGYFGMLCGEIIDDNYYILNPYLEYDYYEYPDIKTVVVCCGLEGSGAHFPNCPNATKLVVNSEKMVRLAKDEDGNFLHNEYGELLYESVAVPAGVYKLNKFGKCATNVTVYMETTEIATQAEIRDSLTGGIMPKRFNGSGMQTITNLPKVCEVELEGDIAEELYDVRDNVLYARNYDEDNDCLENTYSVEFYPCGKTDEVYVVPDDVTGVYIQGNEYLKDIYVSKSVNKLSIFDCNATIHFEGTESEFRKLDFVIGYCDDLRNGNNGIDSMVISDKVEFNSDIPTVVTPGDVDGDGNLSAGDARLALRCSVDLENYEDGDREFIACDVNADGKVQADDARLILRGAVELEDTSAWKKSYI